MTTKSLTSVGNDPQLLAVQRITDPETLLEVMLKKFASVGRDEANLFISRIVLAGRKNDAVENAFGPVITKLMSDASKAADEGNPFCRSKGESGALPSGTLIEYDDCFIHFIEGYERHLMEYMRRLQKHCEYKDAVCFDVCVLFLTDDVLSPSASLFAHIDKVPPSALEGDIPEKEENEVADMVLEDLANLVKICTLASNERGNKRKQFLDSARVSHPSLFPRAASIKLYISKNELFLSLKECVDIFGRTPKLTRSLELNHPVEDPLKY